MLARCFGAAAIAAALLCLLGPGTSFANVKCQCNNGTIADDMSSDYDDPDLDAACDDACSESGGGRVWKPEVDEEDGDDVTITPRRRHHEEPELPR